MVQDARPRVSVIVPIYNVEDHVAACINSLRAQTFTDFDVWMIDDGSIDTSAARAMSAVGNDPRFHLIRQNNHGLSHARNQGLDRATGDFIAFIDSDDQVAPDYLATLLAALDAAPDSPWVACAIRNLFADGQTTVHSAIFDLPDPTMAVGTQRFTFRRATDVIRHYPSAWNKLYRRDFIGDLRFPEGVWFEDHAFFLTLAMRAGHLLHVAAPLYEQTRDRPGQITTTDSDRVFDQLDVLHDILPLLKNGPLPNGETAAAKLASRLVSERSLCLQAPDRRAAFAQEARACLADHGVTYMADPTQGSLVSWGLEMAKELPLSVIVPWDGRACDPLGTTLLSIAVQRAVGAELIIVCDSQSDAVEARSIATQSIPDHGQTWAKVITARGRTMGHARQAGLAQATGRYVIFVDAGDVLEQDALHMRVEAMLALNGNVGLSARSHGPARLPDAGFSEPYVPAHQNRPAVFTPTPRQALDADLSISAVIFERAFLDRTGLQPAVTTRHGEWPLILGALLKCQTAVYLPTIDVSINPTDAARGVLSRPASVLRLNRDHKTLCAALPQSAAAQLPQGWQRRLLARALRLWLVEGPDRGFFAGITARASAAALIMVRGMGQTMRFYPAGFDPQIGPKFARLFDTIGLLRLLRPSDRHRDLTDVWLVDPRSTSPSYPLRLFNITATPSSPAQLRFGVDFTATPIVKLSFVGHNGRTVPLHVVLDQKSGEIRCNDTRSDGLWRAERVQLWNLDLQGVILRIDIAPSSRAASVRIWINDTLVWTLKRRSLTQAAGFAGLSSISHLHITEGLTPLSIRPDGPQLGLSINGRLQLLYHGPITDQTRVTLDGRDDPLTLIADETGGDVASGVVLLPARIWRDHPEDISHVIRATHPDRPDQTLTITRADMARHINSILEMGLPASDAELVIVVIETVAFACLSPLLASNAQIDLARLASLFGLEHLLTDLVVPPRHQADYSASVLRNQVNHIARIGPQTALLDTLPPDPIGARHLMLQTVEWAVHNDRVDDLYREGKSAGLLTPATPFEDIWSTSASLPMLWLNRDESALRQALIRLSQPEHGWRVTPAMGWVGMAALNATPFITDEMRVQTLDLLLDWLDAEAGDYFGRTDCAVIVRWVAALVLNLDDLPRPLAKRAIRSAIRAYGLNPQFWAHLEDETDSRLPSLLAQARSAYAQVHVATNDETRASALYRLHHMGLRDSTRARIEYLGPASVPLRPQTPLRAADLAPLHNVAAIGEMALRHAACPGTAPLDPDLAADVRDHIRDLSHNQNTPPYMALQQRVHRRITAFLTADQSTPKNLDTLLSDLASLTSPASNFIGFGLALSLLGQTDDTAQDAKIANWLLAYDLGDKNAADICNSPAVRMGLARLSPRTDQVVDTVRAHFAQHLDLATLPNLPSTADGLPAPHPLNDVIVMVFSCHPFLNTRIPALRDGWLADLADMGIPYVIVVGDGDDNLRGDVLHVNAPDDYEGLPAKTLATLDWVRRNTSYAHMFKVDDDCLVDAPALFGALSWRGVDYMGRKLHRTPGQMDRVWHQEKASSDRGKLELDKSPEPSTYADGGSGYILSRDAIEAACRTATSSRGRKLIKASFMEDKLLGDLLTLGGISLSTPGYFTSVRRRTFAAATPVAYWNTGFYPSLASPTQQVHMDTHLHQAEVLALRHQPVLEPPKIWPSFQSPRLGYQSNALELISDPKTAEAARAADVAVVSVMRNEAFILPSFLAHYRRLGVTSFLIADNISDDGSREYLLDQPDVALFSVDTDYNQSRYGVAWQQAMLHAFRRDRWSLVADADELLVWQAKQTQTLPDLLNSPDFDDATAVRIFMLDMYPKGTLDTATFAEGLPFEQAGFADREPFIVNPLTRGPYSNQTLYTSAVRHRLLPRTRPDLFAAQKFALLKYQPQMRLSAGLHFVAGACTARRDLIFGHFKYNADFFRKAQDEVARKQHFNNAEEYRRYLALAAEGRAQIYDADLSLSWDQVPFVKSRLI